jgi:hypothetical protein
MGLFKTVVKTVLIVTGGITWTLVGTAATYAGIIYVRHRDAIVRGDIIKEKLFGATYEFHRAHRKENSKKD